jgi:hypothetical protein
MSAAGPAAEKLLPAKNGELTLYRGETALHSRYDPAREAEKYVNSLELEKRDYRCFILIEPGLGYLVPVLRGKFPFARIVSLHCSAFFETQAAASRGTGVENAVSWTPASDTDLEDFLEETVPDIEADQIRVLEWRPAAAAYGTAFTGILGRTLAFLKRLSAGRATVRSFGRRWLRNALRNLDLVRRPVQPRRVDSPVAVCASGPGLERDAPKLAAWKASPSPPLVLAVSSSVSCLASTGIVPDIVITTDGGSWALFHLVECFRFFGAETSRPLFIAALSAALPSQIAAAPVLFLADGSLWQQYLLRSFGLPFLAFPQRGTVSASALDAAFFLSSGPVCVSGIDFRHYDLLTHSRPYAFDRLREESAYRLNPAYSQAFRREELIRSGGALSVYGSWFKKALPQYPKRLYALSEENRLEIFPFSKAAGNAAPSPRAKLYEESEAGAVSPGGRGIACLEQGLRDPAAGKQIAKELGELLDIPAGENPQIAGIVNELRAACGLTENNGRRGSV